MNRILRWLFYGLFVRPAVFFLLGLNVYHLERLPKQGPAIIAANHNSHLDTMVLMSLLPLKYLSKTKPVAAEDYFLRTRLMRWFAMNIIGIIPISRKRQNETNDPLLPITTALEQQNIIIFFPEGSRGEPEQRSTLKSGIAHLAMQNPTIPVYPIFIRGTGKALPKGEALLVPFIIDVHVGEPLYGTSDKSTFMQQLEQAYQGLMLS